MIVAKNNYGQGSSREHAAIAPRYLGIKAVIANSFARIHRKNLINFGILPIELGVQNFDASLLDDVKVTYNRNNITVWNVVRGTKVEIENKLSDEEFELIAVGGLLNRIKNK